MRRKPIDPNDPLFEQIDKHEALIDELVTIAMSDGLLASRKKRVRGLFDEWGRSIRAREIGEILSQAGGFRLMYTVAVIVVENSNLDQEARMNIVWGDIGGWMA